MKRVFWILLFIVLLGCEDTATFDWTAREYHAPDCADCPLVEVAIPEGPENNRLAAAVRQSLREEIILWLDYAEENTASSIEEAMASFGEGYREVIAQFPDETLGWEARIEGLVSYESPKLLSISLDGYIFTGGAHGYTGRRFLNFDVSRASELEPGELFANTTAFQQMAETAFREAYGIPLEGGINSTGFMFENNQFRLPENIGFTPQGIMLYYNPYEVASYADGPLELTIPFEQAAPYISERLKPLTSEAL